MDAKTDREAEIIPVGCDHDCGGRCVEACPEGRLTIRDKGKADWAKCAELIREDKEFQQYLRNCLPYLTGGGSVIDYFRWAEK